MTARLRTRTTHARDGVVVVMVTGEIDLSNADTLRTILLSAATDPAVRLLVCDLSKVDFIGCGGLSAILAVQSTLSSRGASIRLVARNRAVLRPLAVTGLLGLLEVRPHLTAALSG